MTTHILGTVQSGVIVPHEPIDWPDGTEVEVCPSCVTMIRPVRRNKSSDGWQSGTRSPLR
jgi:hypothetical protein